MSREAMKILPWFKANYRTIRLTLEVFWILVFILDRMTSGNTVEVPQFIYVNF